MTQRRVAWYRRCRRYFNSLENCALRAAIIAVVIFMVRSTTPPLMHSIIRCQIQSQPSSALCVFMRRAFVTSQIRHARAFNDGSRRDIGFSRVVSYGASHPFLSERKHFSSRTKQNLLDRRHLLGFSALGMLLDGARSFQGEQ